MDALLTAVIQSTPQMGVAGLLITYIVILIRREGRVDDKHSADLDQRDRLHASELERLNRDHDVELAELTAKIRELRRDIDDLDGQLRNNRRSRLGLPPQRIMIDVVAEGVLDDDERID